MISHLREPMCLLDVGTGLTIEGSVTGNAEFYIGWSGARIYSRLHVTGDLSLQPSMVFFVLSPDGCIPQAGDSVQWLGVDGVDGVARGGDALDWRIVTQGDDAACAGCELYDWAAPDGIRVSFTGGVLSLQPVPEPGTWALWMIDVAALAVRRWRR